MAHKKAGGSAKTNRDSISKRLGIKKFGGELIEPGNIILRQKGSKFYPGVGVKKGNDFTLFSMTSGTVHYKVRQGKRVVEVVAR